MGVVGGGVRVAQKWGEGNTGNTDEAGAAGGEDAASKVAAVIALQVGYCKEDRGEGRERRSLQVGSLQVGSLEGTASGIPAVRALREKLLQPQL